MPQCPIRLTGLSDFDAPYRLAVHNDGRLIDWGVGIGFNAFMIVPASVYRTRRTLQDGVNHLPWALAYLRDRGAYGVVIAIVDRRDYGLDDRGMRAYFDDIAGICARFDNSILIGAIEPWHGTQQIDPRFLAGLDPKGVPFAAGDLEGNTDPEHPSATATRDWVSIHLDRNRSIEDNADRARRLQEHTGRPVWSTEPNAFSPHETRPTDRTDPAWCGRLGAAHKAAGLAASTLHLRTIGLTGNMDEFHPSHEQAAKAFLRGWE